MMLPMTSTPDMGGAAGGRAAERAVVSSGCLISRCLRLQSTDRGLVPGSKRVVVQAAGKLALLRARVCLGSEL